MGVGGWTEADHACFCSIAAIILSHFDVNLKRDRPPGRILREHHSKHSHTTGGIFLEAL